MLLFCKPALLLSYESSRCCPTPGIQRTTNDTTVLMYLICSDEWFLCI